MLIVFETPEEMKLQIDGIWIRYQSKIVSK